MRVERGNSLRREKALLEKLNETVKANNEFWKIMTATLPPLHENDALIAKRLDEVVKSLNKSDAELAKQIAEAVKGTNQSGQAIVKRLKESLARLPKDDLTWKQEIATLKTANETLEKTVSGYDKKLVELKEATNKDLKTRIEELDAEVKANKTEIKAEKDKEIADLKETYEKKLEETKGLAVRVDNLEEKRKGKFQGHNKTGEEQPQEYAEDPRKGD